jgi:hypothetical protein
MGWNVSKVPKKGENVSKDPQKGRNVSKDPQKGGNGPPKSVEIEANTRKMAGM